jgi:5-formyltetrahydrofolate cyclo-ligase
MDDPADRKAEARRAAFARRKAAHVLHRAALSTALRMRFDGVSGAIVAGYLPIRTEADPLPAMTALAASNRVCVPVIEGPDRPLAFREWRPGCRLREGPFRVMVPEGGAALIPEILIVPMLAFDARLYRLGYGGGFYDRTLEMLRAAGPRRAIGAAYAVQEADDLPVEATDQPLEEIVTEAGVRHPV